MVDSLSHSVTGQTQPSFSYLPIAVLASSWRVAALSHIILTVLSQNKLSMKTRLLVLMWMSRPRYNGRAVSWSRLCLAATESALPRFMVFNTSSCVMDLAGGLIFFNINAVLYFNHIKSFLLMQKEMLVELYCSLHEEPLK